MNIVILIFFAFLSLFIGEIIYFFLTLKRKELKIKKKYKIIMNNTEELILIDYQNIEYVLEEGLFISKKKCYELWNKIEENVKYQIEYYNLNLPKLDIKYKIINAK